MGIMLIGKKTQLLVKPEFLQEAERIFIGTGIQIVTSGVQYLGSPIGSEEFVNTCVHHAVSQWCGQIDKLRLCLHEKFQPGSSSARVESLYDRQKR